MELNALFFVCLVEVRLQITCNVSHISSPFQCHLFLFSWFSTEIKFVLCCSALTVFLVYFHSTENEELQKKNVFIRLALVSMWNLVLQVLGLNAAYLDLWANLSECLLGHKAALHTIVNECVSAEFSVLKSSWSRFFSVPKCIREICLPIFQAFAVPFHELVCKASDQFARNIQKHIPTIRTAIEQIFTVLVCATTNCTKVKKVKRYEDVRGCTKHTSMAILRDKDCIMVGPQFPLLVLENDKSHWMPNRCDEIQLNKDITFGSSISQ